MSLGEMTPLRHLCAAKGLSRRAAAEEAGLSRQTLYNIEAGQPPSLVTIYKLAPVLGLEPAELIKALGFDNDPRMTAAA